MWSIAALKLSRNEVFEFTCVPLENFLRKFRDRGRMWATKLSEKNIFILDTFRLQNKYYIMYIWTAYLIFLARISRKSQNSNLNYIMKFQRHYYSGFLDASVWSYFGLNRVWLSSVTRRLRKHHSWCENRRPRSSTQHVYTRAQNFTMSIRCFSSTLDKYAQAQNKWYTINWPAVLLSTMKIIMSRSLSEARG